MIGKASQTLVLKDKWTHYKDLSPTIPVMRELNPYLKVMELIDGATNSWNLQRLRKYVDPSDIPLILSLRLSSSLNTDGYCWHYTTSDKYTIKSGYEVAKLKQDEETSSSCNNLQLTLLRRMFGK